MSKEKYKTSIIVWNTTRNKLDKFGAKNVTYDEIINKLMKLVELANIKVEWKVNER